jgi:hypothetical protein
MKKQKQRYADQFGPAPDLPLYRVDQLESGMTFRRLVNLDAHGRPVGEYIFVKKVGKKSSGVDHLSQIDTGNKANEFSLVTLTTDHGKIKLRAMEVVEAFDNDR